MSPESSSGPQLPSEPIHRVVGPLTRFLHVEAASGVVLLAFTLAALALANSAWSESYAQFWSRHLLVKFGAFEFDHSLKHIINDGLMTVFFFVIGLEVKRELVTGELRDFSRASLPVAAAVGGMLAPAGFYLVMQWGQDGARGWGVPMATDIAFVVGCMAIMGKRVPRGLRVMLLSLAIADDIGAILVIAIGYTDDLNFQWLVYGFLGVGAVHALARLGVRSFGVYVAVGVFIWYAFHESKVHATIAGVILGLMTPSRAYVSQNVFTEALHKAFDVMQGDWESEGHRTERLRQFRWVVRETVSPLEYLETTLHPWVSFAIMPLFAFANAGVPLKASAFTSDVALAVMLGLVVGKPVGIVACSWLAVKSGVAKLPQGVNWLMVVAGGCLSGIGFTMAIFIASLAFKAAPELLDVAKIGVLAASFLSASLGIVLLLAATRGADAPAAQ